MNNVGREESRYTVNTVIYWQLGWEVLLLILAIWLRSFSQGKLSSFFLARDDREMFEILSVCSIVVIITSILTIIDYIIWMKSYLSVCESGIEGRTTAAFPKPVTLPYSDISSVNRKRNTVIITTKNGETLRFCIQNAELCEGKIKGKML